MTVRLATRGSALALAQARLVASLLGGDVELVTVTTSGDQRRLVGDKSRWVKEIEEALLDGRADLAVHSAKDVPGELPDGLAIVGVPARADARDSLCGAASSIDELPTGAVVGTSALRRRAQLLAARPDLDVRDVRGNVDTRLAKLADGEYDALILAAAGLERLGRADAGSPLPVEVFTPAPGQGCLAIEARADDARARDLAASITDRDALTALTAERALVVALEATCDTPVAAYAEPLDGGDRLAIRAFAGMPDGSSWMRDALEADAGDPASLGRAVAERMLAAGAAELLAAATS
ncbi:MAG: hydroxymethylbilane synthase [Thermoleophilales bacterium]|nr:hydroxymethylbilane synthase [Thermoleophilales bacterium]